MKLSTRESLGAIIATVEGHIDHLNADGFMISLRQLLAREEDAGRPLVLDFSKVVFISSAGLRGLIVGAQEARQRGRKMAVAAAQPMVQEVFSISRLQLILPCYLEVGDACGALT